MTEYSKMRNCETLKKKKKQQKEQKHKKGQTAIKAKNVAKNDSST